MINIIGREITSQIVKEIGNCRAWALIADTTPDVSHHEQLSICARIVNYNGKCSKHLLSCKRASGTKAMELYKLISETLISKSVSFDKLVAQTYDGASNMIGCYNGLIASNGMVWYGNTLFNDAGPDSNLLVSTGGVKTLTIYKKEKKEEIFTCEYFWCEHNYHLAIISSNNILKLVDRFGYLCVKREAIPQFSPTIIETLFEELSIWFRKG